MDTYFEAGNSPKWWSHATRIGKYTGQRIQIVLIDDPKYGKPVSDEDAAIALWLRRPKTKRRARWLPTEAAFTFSGLVIDPELTRIVLPGGSDTWKNGIENTPARWQSVDYATLEKALNRSVAEWAMYIWVAHNKELSELKPGILKYTKRYAEWENKWLYEYEIGDDIYLSYLPPNAYAVYPWHKLYYKSFEWKKVGDEYVRSHVACFPLSQKSKLEALKLL